jgi:CheY-like chemotaxis protein
VELQLPPRPFTARIPGAGENVQKRRETHHSTLIAGITRFLSATDTGFEDLPIVAVSAKAMPGDREKCLEAGCVDFVAKPVDGDQLMRIIRRCLA